jgi:hypothetical protein
MSTKHLLALLNSHIEGDEEQFLSIALQVAAQEARHGRIEDADKLKRLVQRARDRQRSGRPAGHRQDDDGVSLGGRAPPSALHCPLGVAV